MTTQHLIFTEDSDHTGCFFVFFPADKYDGAIGYVSPNEAGRVRYHPSVSFLYGPDMLEEISAFIRKGLMSKKPPFNWKE